MLFIYVGFKPVTVGTWRYSGITHRSESGSCWRNGSVWRSCCLLAGQYQRGIAKPANEFKMAFKIGALAENDLQEANKMTKCVM